MVDIGKRIKQIMQQKHLTQKEVAKMASISRTYLSGIESGLYNPRIKTLARLAAALGVELVELFDERGDKK